MTIEKINEKFGKNPIIFQSIYSGASFVIDGINNLDFSEEIVEENSVEDVEKVTFYNPYNSDYISEDDMTATYEGAGAYTLIRTNAGINKGKWYGEFKFKSKVEVINPSTYGRIGVVTRDAYGFFGNNDGRNGFYRDVTLVEGDSIKNGDIVNFAVNFETGKIYYGINGEWKSNPVDLNTGDEIPNVGRKYYTAVSTGRNTNGD